PRPERRCKACGQRLPDRELEGFDFSGNEAALDVIRRTEERLLALGLAPCRGCRRWAYLPGCPPKPLPSGEALPDHLVNAVLGDEELCDLYSDTLLHLYPAWPGQAGLTPALPSAVEEPLPGFGDEGRGW